MVVVVMVAATAVVERAVEQEQGQAEGAVLARTSPKPPQSKGSAVVHTSSSCRQTGCSSSSSCS